MKGVPLEGGRGEGLPPCSPGCRGTHTDAPPAANMPRRKHTRSSRASPTHDGTAAAAAAAAAASAAALPSTSVSEFRPYAMPCDCCAGLACVAGDLAVTTDYACKPRLRGPEAPRPSTRCRPRPGPTACAGSTPSTRFMRPPRRTPRPPPLPSGTKQADFARLMWRLECKYGPAGERVEEREEDEEGEGRAVMDGSGGGARAQTIGSFMAEFLATVCPSKTTAGFFE